MTYADLPDEYRTIKTLYPFTVAGFKGDSQPPNGKETLYFCNDCMQWVEGHPHERRITESTCSGVSFRCVACGAYMGFLVTLHWNGNGRAAKIVEL